MGYILIFLLIIFLVFGWPLLRVFLALRKARRQFNEMYGNMYGGRQAPRQESRRTSRDSRRPRRRGKIITSDVGEYVEFEELPGKPDPAPAPVYKEISQIEDADWEDIR